MRRTGLLSGGYRAPGVCRRDFALDIVARHFLKMLRAARSAARYPSRVIPPIVSRLGVGSRPSRPDASALKSGSGRSTVWMETGESKARTRTRLLMVVYGHRADDSGVTLGPAWHQSTCIYIAGVQPVFGRHQVFFRQVCMNQVRRMKIGCRGGRGRTCVRRWGVSLSQVSVRWTL